MKHPISTLVIVLLLFAGIGGLRAQEKPHHQYKNYLSINASRLIVREIRVSYERKLSLHHSAGISFGKHMPSPQTSYRNYNFLLFSFPINYRLYDGYYGGLRYSYQLIPKAQFYVAAEMYYDYKYYDNKYYCFCVGTDHDSYVSLESVVQRKSGLKIIAGKKVTIFGKGKVGLVLDVYYGFGLQYKETKQTEFGRTQGGCSVGYYSPNGAYGTPKVTITHLFVPTGNFGVLISLATI